MPLVLSDLGMCIKCMSPQGDAVEQIMRLVMRVEVRRFIIIIIIALFLVHWFEY